MRQRDSFRYNTPVVSDPQLMQILADRQLEIFRGQKPSVPAGFSALEKKAREILEARIFDYVAGGAGGERTMQANLDAFYRWRIVPRLLRDVSQRNLTVDLLGARLPAPLILGPVGAQGILHPSGEVATAKAAASLGIPFVLSTVSSYSIEQVAAAMPGETRWFQLYPCKDPQINGSLLRRAENAGYSAVIVTLDTRLLGWRDRDLDHGYLPFLEGQGLANYFSDPIFRSHLGSSPEGDPRAAIRHWASLYSHAGSTWEDFRGLHRQTRLPVLLKGILHPDDARRALDHGVEGLIVSNHGGRQVDGAIAALDALPAIVKVIGNRLPVLFDSGIRRGSDIVKALALGAEAVLLARPYCWGLAIAGEKGVCDAVLNLLADFDVTLALAGVTAARDLDFSILSQ
jgi:lactate 2-monooxygenase